MKAIHIIRAILNIIAITVILIAVFCLIFRYRPATVMSGSMEPAFHTGSVVFIDEKQADRVEVGDAIAFRSGDAYITHRIVSEDNGSFVTKGDGNECEDPWRVSREDVVGKVVLSIPMVGYFCRLLAGPPGIIAVVVITMLTILSCFIKKPAEEDEYAEA